MRVDALCSRVNEPFQNTIKNQTIMDPNSEVSVLNPGEHDYASLLPGLWAPACPEPVIIGLMAT